MSDTTSPVRTNWQKFTLLLVALAIMGILCWTGRVTWDQVSVTFGIIVGYGTANGIGAVRGQSPAPLFSPTNPTRRADDTPPTSSTSSTSSTPPTAAELRPRRPLDPRAARPTIDDE